MRDNWYLKYNENITEEMYNRIIEELHHRGYTPYHHIGKPDYVSFKRDKFLRRTFEHKAISYCTDNNKQWGLEEINVWDILNSVENYQIY